MALQSYRRCVVLPALQAIDPAAQHNQPPLPWAWLAVNVDHAFPRGAFACWWQFRALGTTYPNKACPWCSGVTLSRSHLQMHCPIFAQKCWTRGVRPEEVFSDPVDDVWFTAALLAIAALDSVASSGADNMPASSVDEQWLVTLH